MTLEAEIVIRRNGFTVDCGVHLQPGSTLAVLGDNGAGKTTLLNALAGLRHIDEGCITMDGTMVDAPALHRWVPPERRRCGVLFQEHRLFPHLTALDNAAYGLRAHGLSRRKARDRALGWLDAVGMAHRSNARSSTLSGGEAQRVALARALAVEPRLLLLDEPLASVDARSRPALREVISTRLAAHDGMRVVVTHDADEAAALADSVLVLSAGRAVTSPGVMSVEQQR